MIVLLKEFFEKINFEKSADNKKACTITQHALRLELITGSFLLFLKTHNIILCREIIKKKP